MKKRFNAFIIIIAALVLAVSAVACTPDPTPTPSTSPTPASNFFVKGTGADFDQPLPAGYTVEYGEPFSVPTAKTADGVTGTVTAVGPTGAAVAIQYGSLKLTTVGEYVLTYTAGELTQTVVVLCQDTIAPDVRLQTHTTSGAVGDEIPMPYYTATDKANIDYTRSGTTIYAPDGTEVAATDGYFTLQQAGEYRLVVSVYDNNGVCATINLTTHSAARFQDMAADTDVLYDFDEEDYLDLTFDVEGKKSATRQIATSGYPTIDGEGADNGVLMLYDPDSQTSTMQDLYVKFRLHTDFVAAENEVSAIKIRFAVSTNTDYVQILRGNFICSRFNMVGGLEAGVWYEMILDPMQWGYYRELDGFVLKFRDKGQTKLYIDEITYETFDFVDVMEENVLADFDEEQYLTRVFQNIYNDPTTQKSYCVDGTVFEHLTSGYPAANAADADVYPSLGATGGVIKFTTQYLYGGITYMFPTAVNVNEVDKLLIKFYSADPQPISWVIGFFDENTQHLKPTLDICNVDLPNEQPHQFIPNQWSYMEITGEELAAFTTSEYVTGVFIQMWPQKFYEPGMNYNYCVMYLDEITIVNK